MNLKKLNESLTHIVKILKEDSSKHRMEHIWKVKDNKDYQITHPDYTDGYHVEYKGKWDMPYRSLVGAKQYIAKKLKRPYDEIEYIYSQRKLK